MKNILITSISILNPKAATIEYRSGITAKQSNEACCKYLLKRGPRPNLIIMLCTKDAISVTKDEKTIRSADYFQDAITQYCQEIGCPVPQFQIVKLLRDAEKSNHFGKAITQVENIIKADSPQNTHILIDTAGGLRNISIMMQSMTKLLNYNGYKTDAYYTNYTEKRVFHDHTDKQMEIMEAIAEFAEHGTVHKLRKYFQNHENQQIHDLLNAMSDFSDSIQICRTEKLPEIMEQKILPALDRLDSLRGAAANHEDIAALKQMTDYIRLRFGWNPMGTKITTIQLIRWCLGNGLIQQAATLYTDTLPKYLLNLGFICITDESQLTHNSMNSPEVTLLYNDIIEGCVEKNAVSEEEEQIHELKQYLEGTKKIKFRYPKVKNVCNEISALKNEINPKKNQSIQNVCKQLKDNGNPIRKKLIDYVKEREFTGIQKMVNSISNNEKLIRELLDIPPIEQDTIDTSNASKEIRKKIDGIESFSIQKMNEQHSWLKIECDASCTEQMRDFLRSYVYIKKGVRNLMNHASEEDVMNDAQLQYFQNHGIDTADLTPQNIKKNIEFGLNQLEKCMETSHKISAQNSPTISHFR